MQVKVLKADGTALIPASTVAPVNLWGAALFEQAQVWLGGSLVSSSSLYHIQSYLKALLSLPINYKENELLNAIYVQDEAPNTIDNNRSLLARHTFIAGSKLCEIITPVYDDMFCSDNPLPIDTEVRLKFKRAPDAFSLITTTTDTSKYQVSLEQCILYVNKIRQSKQCLPSSLSYPFLKTDIRACPIAKDTVNYTADNLYSGSRLPYIIVVALMSTESFNGKITTNPWNFSKFGLTNINITVNNVANDFMSLDISETEYLHAYHRMISELDLKYESIGINRNNYSKGNTIFCFKIVESQSNSSENQGFLSINFNFSDGGASDPITAIILSQFPAEISMNSSGITLQ